jgi:Family of unknown function (DUF6418)
MAAFALLLLSALLAIANALMAKLWPSAGWSISALMLFIACLFAMRTATPRALVLTSPILLLWLSELFSGVLIERGAYLSEARRYGAVSGGFAMLAALYVIFAAAMAAIIETVFRWSRADERFALFRVGPLLVWVVGATFLISGAYAILVGLREGFPLVTGADRLGFRAMLDDRLFEAWHSNRTILAFLFGMVAAGGWRALGLTMLVGLTALSLLFGEKFTSLLMMVCAFTMTPGLVHIAKHGRLPLLRTALPIVALALVTVPAIFAVYGGFDRSDKAIAEMQDRFALQGQAWYLVEAGVASDREPTSTIIAADVRSWFNPTAQNPDSAGVRFGHYYVMKNIAPYAVFDDFYTSNVGFVFLLFPYLHHLGGMWLTLLGGLALCGITAATLSLLALAAARKDYLSVLICLKIFVWQTAGFLLGYLWYFVGIKTVLLLAGLAGAFALHGRLWSQRDPAAGGVQ